MSKILHFCNVKTNKQLTKRRSVLMPIHFKDDSCNDKDKDIALKIILNVKE